MTTAAESSGTSSARSPDRKSTRLNSSHMSISYAVFCLKKKKTTYYTFGSSMTQQTSSDQLYVAAVTSHTTLHILYYEDETRLANVQCRPNIRLSNHPFT